MKKQEAITLLRNLEDALDSYCELNEEGKTAFRMAITALEQSGRNCSESPNGWIPCSEYPEYDFQSVLVRWRDRRIGCENDYYLFEGYVVKRHWCCVFEDVDISFLEAIEWKMIKPYQPKEKKSIFCNDDYCEIVFDED